METKLFDSELRVMEILWKEGDTTAKQIAEILGEQVKWSKTTTYTVIQKCLKKGVIKRIEPNFICKALLTRKQTQEQETTEFINKFYNGSANQLVASVLGHRNLSQKEIEVLKQIIESLE